jgi:sugar lactone lactonase YvrE
MLESVRTAVVQPVVLACVLAAAPASHAAVLSNPAVGTLDVLTPNGDNLQGIDVLSFDAFGNLFVAREVTGAGGGVSYVDKSTGLATNLVNGISRADYIALHPSGDFFVTSEVTPGQTTDRVYRVSVSYDAQNIPTSATAASLETSLPIVAPEGLVVLPQDSGFGNAGDLYVAEDTGLSGIFRIQPDTTPTAETALLTHAPARAEGIDYGGFSGAVTPAIYYAEASSLSQVIRVESDGSQSVVGDPDTVGLTNPDNVRFGPDGFLYVSEDVGSGGGRIIRIAPDGTHSVFITGLSSPQGMIFDPGTGVMYISEQDTRKIWRVTFNPIGGDLDGDGFVGIDDLNTVLSAWNQPVEPASPPDPTGNGFVGIDDLNAVLGDWNEGTPQDEQLAVPEPVTAGLCGAMSLGALCRHRRGVGAGYGSHLVQSV